MEPIYKFTLPEREALIKHMQRKGIEVMRAKAQTYASLEWANQNFWEEAEHSSLWDEDLVASGVVQTPAQNAHTHHTKHIRTIAKFIDKNGQDWVDTEPIEGRFVDDGNYVGIKYSILVEQGVIPLPESFRPILEKIRALASQKPKPRCYSCGSFHVILNPATDSYLCGDCQEKTYSEIIEDFEFLPGRTLLKGRKNGFWYKLNPDKSVTRVEEPLQAQTP